MALSTALQNAFGSATGTALVLLLAKYLGDRSLQGATQRFSLGITSHMATVAFDKYVAFCEEYVEAVSSSVPTFVEEGARQTPLNAVEFLRIRRKWALWLTDDVETKLDKFERLIPRVGSEAPFIEADGAYGSAVENAKFIIAELRKVLAAEELTALRKELVTSSSRSSAAAR